MGINTRWIQRTMVALATIAVVWTLPAADAAALQNAGRAAAGIIDPGTTIYVRTNEEIKADRDTDQVFSAVTDRDVKNDRGRVFIPRGSDAELVVSRTADADLVLDLDAVMINGVRYGVDAESNVLDGERKEGIGANERTGKYVGGGAVVGAIIGAITGGGKGAAIGAGAGAAAGAGAQVLTRGKEVEVPAETQLTFKLTEPLVAGRGRRLSSNRAPVRQLEKPGVPVGANSITVTRDNNVAWNGPENATVYVQVDNEAKKLFAAGQSGTQPASWIVQGHIYRFTMTDTAGNEIAHAQVDTRNR
jgi:hypothetical protein